MSAIASFTLIPASAVEGLREAAKQRRRGATGDGVQDYLKKHGRSVADYGYSGWVLGTLLAYLPEKHAVDLMASDFDDLSTHLTQSRGSTLFFLTPAHRSTFLSRLASDQFSETELREYFNEFNETEEEQVGKAMLDGIACFHQALSALDEDSVVVVQIG